MGQLSNILLIQLGDIGDVVLTTPTVYAIREAYPQTQISLMVRKPFGNILASNPYIYEVVESAKHTGSFIHRIKESIEFVFRLRRAHYDLVIDLRTGDRGAILSLLSGARVRVGRPGEKKQFWHTYAFTRIINGQPATDPYVHPGADQSLRFVRELGMDTRNSMPKLYPTDRDVTRVRELLAGYKMPSGAVWVTVNPFSRWKYKEWHPAKWGDLVDRLWKRFGVYTVLVGSPDEAAACGTIMAGREDHVFSAVGSTSLSELVALISISTLHMGVDSAAPHIAAAVGTPTLTIHGPSNWRDWRVADEDHDIVCPELACVPCHCKGCNNSGRSRCLEELPVEAVSTRAEVLLENIAKRAYGDNIPINRKI